MQKRELEIDIVAFNEETNKILFCECKWLEKANAQKLLNELKEKAKYVNWHNENREEYYAIVAKSFAVKTKQAMCIDLMELEKILH